LKGRIEFYLGNPQIVKYIVLQEYIRLGQRVRRFNIEAWKDNSWQEVVRGTTIGYKRIVRLEQQVSTQKLRVNIEDSRACPVVSNIEIF
jgi:alpha-L-fucosidase